MQSYKSTKNVEFDRKIAKKANKHRGEIPITLEPNTSGSITTKFPNECTEKPFISLIPVITSALNSLRASNSDDPKLKESVGHEFNVCVRLIDTTTSDFTITLQNLSSVPVNGYVQWYTV